VKGIISILVLWIFLACKPEAEIQKINPPRISSKFDDKAYVANPNFSYGDVRRYGIFPETEVPKSVLDRIIELANQGVPLVFPSGYYPISLDIEGAEDISIYFHNAVLGGGISIVEKKNQSSSRIALKGSLTVLDRIFVRQSSDILMDTLRIISDEERNIYGEKNRGLSIYVGSRNIRVDDLKVIHSGGEPTEHYQFSAAAVQLHGWNNNPRNVYIHKLTIRNAERSGIYLTGSGHRIGILEVSGFGSGSKIQMAGLDDAAPGSAELFAGVWINKCENCELDTVRISNGPLQNLTGLRMDPGEAFKPTIIYNLLLNGDSTDLRVEDSELTNVIVKNVIDDESDN
jgi:hypothetical protein